MKMFKQNALSLCVQASLLSCVASVSTAAFAADEAATDKVVGIEVIEVTARKRTENIKDVPISVSALTPKKLEVLGSSGMDVRALSARVPSLLIESSFGRTFPRFYIRGLGNTDFDLLASQPVSLIYDDVVLENALTKGMPMFDLERVEVLRGPQGTLFGRNTTAGIIKVQSKKPTQDFDASVSASYGSFNSTDLRLAVGGGLTDTLSARVALLQQDRSDWIDNKAPGFEQNDQLGGYGETVQASSQKPCHSASDQKIRVINLCNEKQTEFVFINTSQDAITIKLDEQYSSQLNQGIINETKLSNITLDIVIPGKSWLIGYHAHE